MKKRLALFIILMACLMLSACGKEDEENTASNDINTETAAEDDSIDEEIEAIWSQENSSELRVKLDSLLIEGDAELIIPSYNNSKEQPIEYLVEGSKICDISLSLPEKITEIVPCDYNYDSSIDIIIVGYNDNQRDFWLLKGYLPKYEGDSAGFINDDDMEDIVEQSLPASTFTAEDIKYALTNGVENGNISSYNEAYRAVINYVEADNASLDLTYALIYIDEDDIPELLVDDSGYWLSVYSFSDNTVSEPIQQNAYGAGGCVNYEYAPYKNSIRYFGHSNETYGYSLETIQDNKLVSTYTESCYYDNDTVEYSNYTDEQLSDEEIKNRFEQCNSYEYEVLTGVYTVEEFVDKFISDCSIQDELASVEKKYKKLYDSTDSASMSQAEMNQAAYDLYQVWDNELNSLWIRLQEELDAETLTELTAEQKNWISQKEANSYTAGLIWSGGSAQPCITLSKEESMTHKRVYELAALLASARSEEFQIPNDVKKVLDEENPTLNQVFEKFQGQWIFDKDRGAVIGVESSSYDPEMAPKGSSWYVWETGGDVISDLDVYGYSDSDILFHTVNSKNNIETYYWLCLAGDHIELSYANSLEDLENFNGETTVGY